MLIDIPMLLLPIFNNTISVVLFLSDAMIRGGDIFIGFILLGISMAIIVWVVKRFKTKPPKENL